MSSPDEVLAAIWWERLRRASEPGNPRVFDERHRQLVHDILLVHAASELREPRRIPGELEDDPHVDLRDPAARDRLLEKLHNQLGEHLGVGAMPAGAWAYGTRRPEARPDESR